MAIVRHAHAETIAREAIVLDLGDLAKQGDALRARAQAEADRIIAEGKAERTRLIEGAEAKGYEEGLARGLEEGRAKGAAEGRAQAIEDTRAQLLPLAKQWEQAIEDFASERVAACKTGADDLVELAARIVRRVTHRAIELDPDTVREQLTHVMALMLDPSGIVIEVHPEDVEACEQMLPELMERCAKGGDVAVRTRDDLARGSVVVRTGGGVIDASIDGQLDRIVEAMVCPARASNDEASES